MNKKLTSVLGVALVVGIVGLAATLRMYRLVDLPPGLHGDEAHAGIFAQEVLEKGWIGPYASYALGGPAGLLYLMAPVVKLVGASALAVRLTTALAGTAAVLLMYLLARQMFGHRTGLIAAALLAFSYWHIHFSRIAHPVVLLPLAEIAALYFLFLGLRGGRWWGFPVGGVFLGLAAYTYHPFPLFVVAVALVLGYVFLRERRRWRYYLPPLGMFFGVSLLVALPFFQFVAEGGLPDRYRTTSILHDPQFQQAQTVLDKAGVVARKAGRVGASFWKGGNVDGVDGLGGRGLLDPVTGLLFVGGVALCLRRLKDERYLLLLLGAGLGLLGGILSSDVEGQYRRIIVSLPFFVLAAAAFGDYAVQLGERLLPRSGRVVPSLLLVGGLAIVGYLNANYYFRVFAPSPSVRWIFAEDLVVASRYLKTLAPDTYVYFYSERWSWNYETRRFLLPSMKGEDRSREFGKQAPEPDGERPVAFMLLPPYDTLLPQLEARYPGGATMLGRNGNGEVAFQAYYLGPEVAKADSSRGESAGSQ